MLTEDFWGVDCPRHRLLDRFAQGKSRYYFNGFPAGRIGFASLVPRLEEFFDNMWSEPTWEFRPPANLQETDLLVEHFMRTVTMLFQLSDYSTAYIGGDIQRLLVPAPGALAPQPEG